MPYSVCYLLSTFFILFQIGSGTVSSDFFTEFNKNENFVGKPPVFYADNGEHQTVAFPLSRNRERREFQSEILQFLGLSHEPHPKKPLLAAKSDDKDASDDAAVPLYMLDLYKNLQNGIDGDDADEIFGNGQPAFSFLQQDQNSVNHPTPAEELFDPNAADTIMSFINQDTVADRVDTNEKIARLGRVSLDDSHPHFQHLHFDLSEVRSEFQLIGTELRVFYNGTPTANGRINVFGLKPKTYEERADASEEDPLMLLATTSIEPGAGPQWLLLNVTNAFAMWQNSLDSIIRKDLILLMETVNADGYQVAPENFGLSKAFMVGFFNGGNEHAHQRSSRKKRAAGYRGVSRREDYEWPSAWTSFDAKWSRSICQKRTLYVSFRDLGWQDWIIAPDGYAAYYCYGECSFPLNAHMNASNHAIVQTLAHLMNPESVPKPCCAPNKLQPISVLYFDDSNNVVLKKYNNMVVKSCGCH